MPRFMVWLMTWSVSDWLIDWLIDGRSDGQIDQLISPPTVTSLSFARSRLASLRAPGVTEWLVMDLVIVYARRATRRAALCSITIRSGQICRLATAMSTGGGCLLPLASLVAITLGTDTPAAW
jgi:hypothetical protein